MARTRGETVIARASDNGRGGTATLERRMYETSRAAEYFDRGELQAQTGQPVHNFCAVIFKELIDNALDACEAAGLAPAIDINVIEDGEDIILEVSDNGKGISPDTVERILNFETRTSDKAAYRASTRGAQGNALKTVLGIPHALGGGHPVIIEACGIQHTIRPWIDPAGELRIEHDEKPTEREIGTRVTVGLPLKGQTLNPLKWARGFSLLNPHISVKIRHFENASYHANCDELDMPGFYHFTPTVAFPGDWRKFSPTDLTSPHWYGIDSLKRLVFAHIGDSRRGGDDLLWRDFVRQFNRLSGNQKAKAVCAALLGIGRISHFEKEPERVADLLSAMKENSTPPKPSIQGIIGESHFLARFSGIYGDVKRHWFRRCDGYADGIPFVFEAMVAEIDEPGDIFYGVNFTPTYKDPLAGTRIQAGEISGNGLRGALSNGYASPCDFDFGWPNPATAAVFHLTCPALEFMDRGKSSLEIPGAMADDIGKAVWLVVKELYKDAKRREKDARAQERREEERYRQNKEERWTVKEAVFHVLPEAIRKGTGSGKYPISARNLYYQVRPLIREIVDSDLRYNYFSQELLISYQEENGAIEKLYYDPRGILYEPHSGRMVSLGTREVERYEFPKWEFNKLLYIEKKGLWPILKESRIAERYDLAVLTGEGYASTAARELFRNADRGGKYQIFVLHDADPDGYNIARTLRESTRRMPGYSVDVIDLGLHIGEALEMGLETEEFTRKKALPAGLELNEIERQYFGGRQVGYKRKEWISTRVELNAIAPPDLVEFIERKLKDAGATGKVVPPDEIIIKQAENFRKEAIKDYAKEAIEKLLDVPKLLSKVVSEIEPKAPVEIMPALLNRWALSMRQKRWSGVLQEGLLTRVGRLKKDIKTAAKKKLAERIAEGLKDDEDEEATA